MQSEMIFFSLKLKCPRYKLKNKCRRNFVINAKESSLSRLIHTLWIILIFLYKAKDESVRPNVCAHVNPTPQWYLNSNGCNPMPGSELSASHQNYESPELRADAYQMTTKITYWKYNKWGGGRGKHFLLYCSDCNLKRQNSRAKKFEIIQCFFFFFFSFSTRLITLWSLVFVSNTRNILVKRIPFFY